MLCFSTCWLCFQQYTIMCRILNGSFRRFFVALQGWTNRQKVASPLFVPRWSCSFRSLLLGEACFGGGSLMMHRCRCQNASLRVMAGHKGATAMLDRVHGVLKLAFRSLHPNSSIEFLNYNDSLCTLYARL